MTHLYFPTTSIVSLLFDLENRSSAGIAAVGNEGCAGEPPFFMVEHSTLSASVQKAGLIKYARGHITTLDRPGLEKRICEYYEVVKTEYGRLISYKLAF